MEKKPGLRLGWEWRPGWSSGESHPLVKPRSQGTPELGGEWGAPPTYPPLKPRQPETEQGALSWLALGVSCQPHRAHQTRTTLMWWGVCGAEGTSGGGGVGSFQFGCEPRARRRGPRVLPPAPTSPGFVNSRIPAVPLGGGDGGRRGPGELAARLHGSLASPPLLQRRQHRVALRGCERAAVLSQHPRPGARASSPPGGRRRPRRCAAA